MDSLNIKISDVRTIHEDVDSLGYKSSSDTDSIDIQFIGLSRHRKGCISPEVVTIDSSDLSESEESGELDVEEVSDCESQCDRLKKLSNISFNKPNLENEACSTSGEYLPPFPEVLKYLYQTVDGNDSTSDINEDDAQPEVPVALPRNIVTDIMENRSQLEPFLTEEKVNCSPQRRVTRSSSIHANVREAEYNEKRSPIRTEKLVRRSDNILMDLKRNKWPLENLETFDSKKKAKSSSQRRVTRSSALNSNVQRPNYNEESLPSFSTQKLVRTPDNILMDVKEKTWQIDLEPIHTKETGDCSSQEKVTRSSSFKSQFQNNNNKERIPQFHTRKLVRKLSKPTEIIGSSSVQEVTRKPPIDLYGVNFEIRDNKLVILKEDQDYSPLPCKKRSTISNSRNSMEDSSSVQYAFRGFTNSDLEVPNISRNLIYEFMNVKKAAGNKGKRRRSIKNAHRRILQEKTNSLNECSADFHNKWLHQTAGEESAPLWSEWKVERKEVHDNTTIKLRRSIKNGNCKENSNSSEFKKSDFIVMHSSPTQNKIGNVEDSVSNNNNPIVEASISNHCKAYTLREFLKHYNLYKDIRRRNTTKIQLHSNPVVCLKRCDPKLPMNNVNVGNIVKPKTCEDIENTKSCDEDYIEKSDDKLKETLNTGLITDAELSDKETVSNVPEVKHVIDIEEKLMKSYAAFIEEFGHLPNETVMDKGLDNYVFSCDTISIQDLNVNSSTCRLNESLKRFRLQLPVLVGTVLSAEIMDIDAVIDSYDIYIEIRKRMNADVYVIAFCFSRNGNPTYDFGSIVDNSYKCNLCQEVFPERTFRDHIERHVFGSSLICTKCYLYKCTNKLNELKLHCIHCTDNAHLIIRKGKPNNINKPANIPCLVCDHAFALPDDLQMHLKFHTGELNYMCAICGYVCKSLRCLVKHEYSHSQETPPVSCYYCSEVFDNLTSNEETINLRHFLCPSCSLIIWGMKSFLEHCHTNHSSMLISCRKCSTNFWVPVEVKEGHKRLLCLLCSHKRVSFVLERDMLSHFAAIHKLIILTKQSATHAGFKTSVKLNFTINFNMSNDIDFTKIS